MPVTGRRNDKDAIARMHRLHSILIPYSVLLTTVLLLVGCTWTVQAPTPVSPLEPLIPTPFSDSAGATPQVTSTAPTHAAIATREPIAPPPPLPTPYTLRWRVGAGVPDGQSPLIYDWTSPRPGWYLNWTVGYTETMPLTDTVTASVQFHVPDDSSAGMEFAPMVHVRDGDLQPPAKRIAETARQRPGMTWLIGNEPDVRWQDNSTPEEYAEAYHEAYHAIKEADPTAKVAIGGLSQITPLRLRWLDHAWKNYQELYNREMPVDVWNMHAFVLREKRNDWGVDMPPGFDNVEEGELWTIEDHDDLTLVEEQVRRMRAWMAAHGQVDKPLWITEYGILMPASYGFDEERVRSFLLASNDLFANLREPSLGMAADGDRLVQRWLWFSTGYDLYPTGDLFTRDGRPTGLMHALSAYLEEFE